MSLDGPDVSEAPSNEKEYIEPETPTSLRAWRMKMNIAEELERNIRDMGETWTTSGVPLSTFFPITKHQHKFLIGSFENYRTKAGTRWTVPPRPRRVSELITPLRFLLNHILIAHKIPQSYCRVFDTCSRGKNMKESVALSHPSLLLAATGIHFVNCDPTFRPHPRTRQAISPIEVIMDSDTDIIGARDRLALHVRSAWFDQLNRRFMHGLVLTETMCTVYLFDHSGVLSFSPFNYHEQPAQFCALLAGLGTRDIERVGFDRTMRSIGTMAFITTSERYGNKKSTEYVLEALVFHHWAVVGRATMCFRCYKQNVPDEIYLIKDCWVNHNDRESETSLLRHIHNQGVHLGVIQLLHYEELKLGSPQRYRDTVLHCRRIRTNTADNLKLDRVHTRLVLQPFAKTLDAFSTRVELITGLYDTVMAHQNIHQKARILHRDISPRNILLNPTGAEGNRGILIDFDHAVRLDDTSPYSTQPLMGTFRFLSVSVIAKLGPYTYLDDLESFFYVLCWITAVFFGPGQMTSDVPYPVNSWDFEGAYERKAAMFAYPEHLIPVDPWFGPSIHSLVSHLFSFFKSRQFNRGKPLSQLDPSADYDEYLSHIQRCMIALEREEAP